MISDAAMFLSLQAPPSLLTSTASPDINQGTIHFSLALVEIYATYSYQ